MLKELCEWYLNRKRFYAILKELEFANHLARYALYSQDGLEAIRALEAERDKLWPLVVKTYYC
jgi:hypothetical protein